MRSQCRDPARYLAWLGQIAHREALRLWVQGRPLETFHDAAHTCAYDETADLPTRLAVERLLLEFDDRDRELLRLRFEEDLTYSEIARRLETSVGAAKVRLHRLKARLRTRLIETECR